MLLAASLHAEPVVMPHLRHSASILVKTRNEVKVMKMFKKIARFTSVSAILCLGIVMQLSPLEAQAAKPCGDWCEIMECSFGPEWCYSACYDGSSWTWCFQP